MTQDWLYSDGGPHMLLPSDALLSWQRATDRKGYCTNLDLTGKGMSPICARGASIVSNRFKLGLSEPAGGACAWRIAGSPRKSGMASLAGRARLTDFDAACHVPDPAGLLRIGRKVALVYGDDPAATTWIPSSAFAGGILVVPREWPDWPDVPQVQNLLDSSVERSRFARTGLILPVLTDLALVAAADSAPDWTYGIHVISPPRGRYEILRAYHAIGDYEFLLLGLAALTGWRAEEPVLFGSTQAKG